MPDDDSWLSISDAARVAGVSERTIQRRINKGQYATKTIDGKRVIHLSDGNDTELSEMSQTVSQGELLEQIKQDNERLQNEINALQETVRRKDEALRSLEDKMADASQRHDTVVMQISRMLEYERQPFWRRWRTRKALPASENVVDMEPGTDEKQPGDNSDGG